MSIAAGQSISQIDMAVLATYATEHLLPLVNALSADDLYDQNLYDKYDGGYPIPNNVITPQPDYDFSTVAFANLIPSGAVYDGGGSYVYSVATTGDYEVVLRENSFTVDSATPVTYAFTQRSLYLLAGETITFAGTAGKLVTSQISKARNWLSEYNRIRGDFFMLWQTQFTEGNGGLYQNLGAICSGPWVVAVNDPDTYPMKGYTEIPGDYEYIGGSLPIIQGTLNASYPGSSENTTYALLYNPSNVAIFNNVSFICAASDADGLSIKGQMLVASAVSPMAFYASDVSSITIQYTGDTAGPLTWYLIYGFSYTGSGSPPAAPDPSTFTLSSPANVTWSTQSVGGGNYLLIAAYNKTISAGGSDSSVLEVTAAPTNFSLPAFPSDPYSPGDWQWNLCGFYAQLNFTSVSTHSPVNALQPFDSAEQFNIPDNGPHSSLVFTATNGTFASGATTSAICLFTLSNTGVKGVWVAKTLPVPGNNVFLDQCMPPFINGQENSLTGQPIFPYPEAPVGISLGITDNTDTLGTSANPLASSMMQAAGLLTPGINPTVPGLMAQPAQWLVRRDTDFVPFELGFNANIQHVTYGGQSAGGYYGVSVPPDATSVKIRIVQTGTTPGWYNGAFQYGQPITAQLRIYISASGYPTLSSYDFFTSNNAVTIPSDGGAAYITEILNGGFDFWIYDPEDTGATFDVYVEIDLGNPERVYFPPIGEVFSYCLNGDPAILNRQYESAYLLEYGLLSNKPIPQNGYCIFKVRATRLPVLNGVVPASGDEIVITLGQNKLVYGPASPFTPPGGMGGGGGFGGIGGMNNAPGMGGQVGLESLVFTPFLNGDGSNLTITIPADAASSGDVEVFIVCLAGNELVWQASETVKVEAYANFQPIFFFSCFAQGQYLFDTDYYFNQPQPMVFQYGLAFMNQFRASDACGWPQVNYPGTDGDDQIASSVTFPIDHNIYNDLMTCLDLIT